MAQSKGAAWLKADPRDRVADIRSGSVWVRTTQTWGTRPVGARCEVISRAEGLVWYQYCEPDPSMPLDRSVESFLASFELLLTPEDIDEWLQRKAMGVAG